MEVLADENVHSGVVRRLRAAGHDVEWLAETAPGSTDESILRRRDIGRKLLITYDRDFGALIFLRDFPQPRAVIYSRLGRAEPGRVADLILSAIEQGLAPGHMVTITTAGVRLTPFPDGTPDA